MKITCECLVDSRTGLPLVLDFPNHTKEDLTEIRTRAWESGQRFRLGLLASDVDLDEQMEDCSQPSSVNSVLESLGNWLNADKKALGRSTNDPLAEFAKMSAERAIANGFGLRREAFQEIWDQTLGPAIESGDVEWECSDALTEHLEKVGRGELSDDEIEKLMDEGKL